MSEHPEATPPRLHQRFRGLIAAVILLTLILVLRVLAPWAVVWPEALILPLKDWIGAAMDWLIHDLSFGLYTFQELSRDTTIGPVSWVGAIFGAMILMHKLGGWRLAGLTLFCFGYMAAFGLWQSSMKTLSSILIAVPFGCFAGLMLGILAHRSRRMERAVVVLLDFMQTVPVFAYLLPVLFLLCQSRSKKGQCPGAKLDTWFDLGAHPGACAFQIADACQGALAAGQPFRSFGIFRITVWRFCSGATGSFRRSSRGYGRGGLGDREWRL